MCLCAVKAPARRARAGAPALQERATRAWRSDVARRFSPPTTIVGRRRRARSRPTGSAGGSDRAKRLRKNGGFNRDRPHISRAQPLCPVCCPLATGDSHLSHLHDGRTRRHGGPRCLAPRSRRRREEKGRRLRRRGSRRASPRARASLRDAPSGNDASFPFTHRTPLVASRSLEANTPEAPSWPASRPISPRGRRAGSNASATRDFADLTDPPLTRAVRQGRGPEGRHGRARPARR